MSHGQFQYEWFNDAGHESTSVVVIPVLRHFEESNKGRKYAFKLDQEFPSTTILGLVQDNWSNRRSKISYISDKTFMADIKIGSFEDSAKSLCPKTWGLEIFLT